jgi:hypothetical protein
LLLLGGGYCRCDPRLGWLGLGLASGFPIRGPVCEFSSHFARDSASPSIPRNFARLRERSEYTGSVAAIFLSVSTLLQKFRFGDLGIGWFAMLAPFFFHQKFMTFARLYIC